MEWWNLSWQWKDMCGPAGMQAWDETTKDLGWCFQELFLQIPLCFLIAIISGYYVGYRKDWVVREKTHERAIVLRSFVVLALVFTPIIELYVFITSETYVLYPIYYFAAGANCLSWLVHFGYVLALKHRLGPSSRGPALLLVLWALAVVLNVISLRTTARSGEGTPIAFTIVTLVCHLLYLLTLIPSNGSRPTFYSPCLVGSQHTHSEYTPLLPHMDEDVLGTAGQGGWFSKLTFAWVNPLFRKGLENKLTDPEELFDLPYKVRCDYIGPKLDKALVGNVDNYQQFQEVAHEPFISSGYGATGTSAPQSSIPVTPTARVLVRPERRQNVSLFRALHSCFAVQFYSIGILKLVSDMAGFAGPILLNKIITFIQDETIDKHMGYIYASALIATSFAAAIFNAHFNWQMSMIGVKMQGALLYTVLSKTLSVTSTELTKSFSVGEVTNFMSTDMDRIVNSCPSFHALWSIPLQLFITLYLLYRQVGLSFLAGVAFSVLLIPINKLIANKIGSLSTEMMHHKDTRVSLISDVLKGIRTIKMHVWEDYFINRVNAARAEEVRRLRGRKYLDAVCVVLWASTPVLVAALTLGTHAARRQPLDAATVFTTIALINMLIAPLNAFPWVLNGLTEAWVSVKRIQKLMDLPDMNPERYYDRLNTNHDEDKILVMKNASFAWAKPAQKRNKPPKNKKNKGKSYKRLSKGSIQRRDSTSSGEEVNDEPFMLKDINLSIGREDFIGITGSVGSGKSSLLHAIMGDMIKKGGSIQIPDGLESFGYVSQKPWLISGTVRDNILFGLPYDESRYKTVVDACALTEEMKVFGNRMVGEGGCTLSGGQRARISLARAVYADKQLYLLDDILSGLDARVARHVVERCVCGVLAGRARVLASSSPAALRRARAVLLLRRRTLAHTGPPEEVLTDIEDSITSECEPVYEEKAVRDDVPHEEDIQEDNVSRDSLDKEETMAEGTVEWWTLKMYLQSVGLTLTAAILLSLVLMQLSQNFTFLWLTFWLKSRAKNSTSVSDIHDTKTVLDHSFEGIDNLAHTIWNGTLSLIQSLKSHNESFQSVTEKTISRLDLKLENDAYTSVDDFYMEMYFGLAAINVVFTVMRAFLFAYGGVQAATRIHRCLLRVIVQAKVKFFDATPSGRVVNRFSSDTYTADDTLPFIINIMLAQLFGLVGAFAVIIYGLPWLSLILIPLLPFYLWLQRRYRASSRALRRLQSKTRSPVYIHTAETQDGLTTIRALGRTQQWLALGANNGAQWQRGGGAAAAAAAWLALRLQLAGCSVAAAAAALAVLQREMHVTDPGTVGLAISYALSMSSMIGGLMSAFTETEQEMIAVERIGDYIRQVEVETVDGDPPPYGWPSQGVITFDNVVLKYSDRPSAPSALSGVSFETRPNEKLGVAGRTGAGKSSLIQAIMRLTPVTHGRVLVDGVPVDTLHLYALRSRIGVIPQEPFIFSGSIRENIDPLHVYTDAEVWRALERCGARAAVEGGGAALAGDGAGLAGGAGELSRGHKQLLCVARALLQRPKIVLIDEATANLDTETERTILDTIRLSFASSTVIFVAHRVLGVLECSRALVLADGKVSELDTPDALLADPTSDLYKLVHAHDA